MDHKEDKSGAEEAPIGDKKFGRLVRMFREGYLSLCIYKNVYENRTFYDIVVYRKIKRSGHVPKDGPRFEYKRGTNLKPTDIPALQMLLTAAADYLRSCDVNIFSTC